YIFSVDFSPDGQCRISGYCAAGSLVWGLYLVMWFCLKFPKVALQAPQGSIWPTTLSQSL
ncbi:hypothetical protein HBI55_252790, partial [Parastagonospora nodorum]